MAKIGNVRKVRLQDLTPYAKNARIHDEKQVDAIAESISRFGFISPVLADASGNVIAGHGRIMAAEKLGMKEVPVVNVEGMSDEERRAYILADNRLAEMGTWDMDTVTEELKDLQLDGFDLELTGFEIPEGSGDWFQQRNRWDDSREEGNDDYNEFLDKFEQPKTTDDCYTPDNIYEAVAEYASEISGISRAKFVRPFYPGGDYECEKYPGGCAVVDNPPFSILAKIVDFYTEKAIPFFLFAPGLSALGYTRRQGVTAICTYEGITYENGASVATSFVTNMVGPDVVAMTAPALSADINRLNKENEQARSKPVPKYSFPVELITSAKLGYLSKYGQDVKVLRDESIFVRTLDAMKEAGAAGIFGSGYLLSEKAAAEKAAAEKAAAEKAAAEKAAATRWPLSEREQALIHALGGDHE